MSNIRTILFKELIADEDKWLTQSANVDDDKRVYFKKKILVGTETAEDFREASTEEKDEFEKRILNLPEELTNTSKV